MRAFKYYKKYPQKFKDYVRNGKYKYKSSGSFRNTMYNDTTGRKKETMKQKTKQSQAPRDKKTRKNTLMT